MLMKNLKLVILGNLSGVVQLRIKLKNKVPSTLPRFNSLFPQTSANHEYEYITRSYTRIRTASVFVWSPRVTYSLNT